MIGESHEGRAIAPWLSDSGIWCVIIDACEHAREEIATGIAWALRQDMKQKAVDADARLDAITAKLNTLSQHIDDAFRSATLID